MKQFIPRRSNLKGSNRKVDLIAVTEILDFLRIKIRAVN